jgi:hypothetical protein
MPKRQAKKRKKRHLLSLGRSLLAIRTSETHSKPTYLTGEPHNIVGGLAPVHLTLVGIIQTEAAHDLILVCITQTSAYRASILDKKYSKSRRPLKKALRALKCKINRVFKVLDE